MSDHHTTQANTDLDPVLSDSDTIGSGLRKNRQTKQPMQSTQADLQLKKVRQAKEQIDRQTQEYQETLKKVKDEVS